MTLTQLEYILAVDRHRGFSRAAESCHVAQPSLSAQVAKLEDELGIQIFDRSKQPIVVTEAGREILEQARLIVDEANRLPEIAARWTGEIRGQLRLGLIPTIAPYLLPTFIRKFTDTYPMVDLIIDEDKTNNLMQKLDTGELDAAIVSTPKSAPEGLIEKPLYYEPFVAFIGPKNPLLAKKSLSPDELPEESVLLLDETHCLRDQVERICRLRSQAVHSGSTRVRLKSGGLDTLIRLVEAEGGYTLLPRLATMTMPAAQVNRSVRRFVSPEPMRKIGLVYNKARLKRALIDALAEIIQKNLPEGVTAAAKAGTKVIDPARDRF